MMIDETSSSSSLESIQYPTLSSSSSSESTQDPSSSFTFSSESIQYPSSSFTSSSESIQYPSSSSTSIKPTIKKTKSNKRNSMLNIDGYHFQFRNFNRPKTTKYWRCANRKCGMILHTTLSDEFIRFGGKMTDHSHLPNPTEGEIRNLREVMRERAENELIPLKKIAEQEIRNDLLTAEALAVLPNVTSIRRSLVRNRQKVTRAVSQSSSFTIPDVYTRDYFNRDRLLLHDSDNPKFQIDQSVHVRSAGRVLVWSSNIQLKLLFDSHTLHMDGTFCTSPPNFEQVFIIQAIYDGTSVPVVYALLPDRKATTYIHLFNVLFTEANKFNKKFDPQLIMTDFEPGLAKAITLEFTENTVQKGCFFHFSQAVYKNVQSLGLSSAYIDNLMIRSVIRQMIALALVPQEYVPSLFAALEQDLSDSERDASGNLFKYFNDYWMDQIPMWNVFDISNRTNNFSEEYDRRFKRQLNKSHSNILLFIDSMQKEINTIHDLIRQINRGTQPHTKQSQSTFAEQQIEELYDRFNNNYITAQDLLRGLSVLLASQIENKN